MGQKMYKRLSIDTVRRTIILIDSESGKENQPLELNRSEYNLLLVFCDSHGEVIDKQTLIERGWPGRVVGDNSLAVAIMKLRKKLNSLEQGLEINNLPGEGYVFINARKLEIFHSNVTSEPIESIKNNDKGEEIGVEESQTKVVVSNTLPMVNISASNEKSLTSNVKAFVTAPMFWELSIGMVIIALTFFFIYREAFECFECYGGFYG
ncbi:C terminal [Vibrio sp. B1FIG11]|jgi:DNA-binding winged helix-turn-helix (wHTH) protein|nr:winged helix-turn-helix domain-containing protein [Vibrio campbellii]AQM67057.1 invasion protein regulator [Vibrio campbellii]CAD7809450.1 C terminal [Vibrio sp. B1FIG11]CAE6909413.1 C terminal [Vibrio sp. B1FIG11]